MAANQQEEIQSIIDGLTEDGNIPGLNKEFVIKNYLEQTNKEYLDSLSKEEREKALQAMIKQYSEQLFAEFNDKINQIKCLYAEVKASFTALKVSVQTAVSTVMLPPAVGPVSPNPAYQLGEATQKKKNFEMMLAGIKTKLVMLFSLAGSILFPIPTAILQLAQMVVQMKKLIDSIPTP